MYVNVHSGHALGPRACFASKLGSVQFRGAPPISTTDIPQNIPRDLSSIVFVVLFPILQRQEIRLLTGQSWFESKSGSHHVTFCIHDREREKLRYRRLASRANAGGGSRWQCQVHLPVAQLDEQRATNAKACRFESCREGQSSSGRRVAAIPPVLGTGYPRFESERLDHPLGRRRLARHRLLAQLVRAPSSEGGCPRFESGRGCQFRCPVAKQKRGGLQNRYEPGQHRSGLPTPSPTLSSRDPVHSEGCIRIMAAVVITPPRIC